MTRAVQATLVVLGVFRSSAGSPRACGADPARMIRTRLWPVLIILLAGCAGQPAPGEGTVELGTGEWEFVPLVDEQPVELIFGVQGGYHVWTSFRAEGLDPEDVMLEIETQRADESRPPERSRVPVDFEMHDGTAELLGWPAILAEPGCVLDEMLRIRVTLTDTHGVIATDERYVLPLAGTGTPAPAPCE